MAWTDNPDVLRILREAQLRAQQNAYHANRQRYEGMRPTEGGINRANVGNAWRSSPKAADEGETVDLVCVDGVWQEPKQIGR